MRDKPSKVFHVCIMASKPRGVLYVGMTSDLAGRAWKHRELVERHNPTWRDLFADVLRDEGFEW